MKKKTDQGDVRAVTVTLGGEGIGRRHYWVGESGSASVKR